MKHVTQDRGGFMEFRTKENVIGGLSLNSVSTQNLFIGNCTKENVIGVGSYQLRLRL